MEIFCIIRKKSQQYKNKCYISMREPTYTAYSAKSTTRILHPPRHIILGNRILSRPLHDGSYFLAERLKNMYDTIRNVDNAICATFKNAHTMFDVVLLSFCLSAENADSTAPISVDVQKIDPLVSHLRS